jgi:2-phosphoglycerate kinase
MLKILGTQVLREVFRKFVYMATFLALIYMVEFFAYKALSREVPLGLVGSNIFTSIIVWVFWSFRKEQNRCVEK